MAHLTNDQSLALFREMWASDAPKESEARRLLIEGNMPLVLHLVTLFLREKTHRRVCQNDLVSAGYVALIRSVDGFENRVTNGPNGPRFIRFGTYAARSIINDLAVVYAADSMPFHVARHGAEEYLRFRACEKKLRAARKDTSVDSVISELGKQPLAAEFMQSLIAAVRSEWLRVSSAKGDSHKGFGMDIEDCREPVIEKPDYRPEIRRLMARAGVPPRIRQIIIMHWGLDGSNPMTYVEIGRLLGVTKQRVNSLSSDGVEIMQRYVARKGWSVEAGMEALRA